MNKVWYKKTAKKWNEALPLGNGFTGLMIYGSSKREKLCFNDGTLWSGYPKNYDSPSSLEHLEEVRSLIFKGKNHEADKLCEKELIGFYSEAFMPLGEMNLHFRNTLSKNLIRSLDLATAVHNVTADGFSSECFSSYPHKVSVYKVKTDKPFSVKITVKSKLRHKVDFDGGLNLLGNAPDYAAPHYMRDEIYPIRYNEKKGMAFCLRTKFDTDGEIVPESKGVTITDATELTLYFVTATGYLGFDKMPETSREAVKEKCISALKRIEMNYGEIKKCHTEDFSSVYNKQKISFDADTDIPTNELIKQVQDGADERALSELFYNFGKYMTISGSRKGGQSLNLQGIWNDSLRPPWSSNYTTNINAEMNYWGASRAGLSECIEPLINMVYEALTNGRKTAEINYGCRGFACNHNVDLWRKTPPVQGCPSYMFAPLCGVWLANEIYTHYENGFLNEYADKINEIVTESARFANDFLVLHDSFYVVCPSTSPENTFTKDGKRCKLDYASAFDMALVRQVFNNALKITADEELRKQISEKLPLLYPYKKAAQGISEWHTDFETPEKGHRHFSPLYGFYPGNTIGYNADREKTEWVDSLFKFRLANSGQHIGWSAAWAMCLASRLRDEKTLQTVIRNLLRFAVFDNLFCVHPPHYFQIDGNLGFIAGINEMLITEENGIIELLTALPENYRRSGEVKNMVVNKAKISFRWADGLITYVESDVPVKIADKNLSATAEKVNITI